MNKYMYFFVLCLIAIYWFFSNVFVASGDSENTAYLDKANFEDIKPISDKALILQEIALLFGDKYESLDTDNYAEHEVLGDIPITIKSIVIVGDVSKVKFEADLKGNIETQTLEIGDNFRDYKLIAIDKRFIRFSKDNNDYTVKVFKPETLTFTLDN
ncbi:hypothetical protein L0668_09985 [Paraglaciecola aquimarina]|uniref:Uncharacterized protein n=1 Tax=Paraglaciecola algarum TaxID=3050085 RepID=A0ABS9D694_9ALTE|nr:hypothetical protein [Paraglaciecola sp. G1-23]MCF2948436.1 hypothetical protein [Paraglaciecola sp. G1-23]